MPLLAVADNVGDSISVVVRGSFCDMHDCKPYVLFDEHDNMRVRLVGTGYDSADTERGRCVSHDRDSSAPIGDAR